MFKVVDPRPNFPDLERKTLAWWHEAGIVKKYLQKNKGSKKRFSFFDGPITANNPMGVHHAWGRTLKDLYQRYKNMQGFQQRFQNGFDCQGLWVEVEVEKELGFNSKKDIEKFGVDKFTQACKKRVDKFANIQTDQSKRLGMFMDWENSYFTNSETNNLYIWNFLKIINEKGWLYKGKSTTTWCPRCETGLSQHEQADGYKDIKDTSLYVKFKIKNRDNEFILAWTTTPWTLPANVLLAINTDFPYMKAEKDGEIFYLAEDAARRLGFENGEKFSAKKLLGLEYESLFDISAQKNIEHKIVEWSLVDPIEGTGVVHIAPGCGQEDYELGKKLSAAIIAPLDGTGIFVNGFGNLSGKFAHDVVNDVIDHLEKKKALYKTETVHHRYPHCWRCGTKCVFRIEDNWFISCDELRPMMKKHAKNITWIPEFVEKRVQDWLDNMGDWMISRKRYYGLSLPFYECSCGKLTVVGSKEELKSLAISPEEVDGLPSLHRPWIDGVLVRCPKCRKAVRRVPDVGDVWLDAGVVPFSTLKYLEDKSYWDRWFPADFICEMVEQVRLWYYSMLVYTTVFEDKVPYLSVLSYVEVRDEKGERMSKTKQNGIPYDEAAEKMGADVMRWLYVRQNPALNLNFGYQIADEVRRRFHLRLWNIYNFFVTYANLDSWTAGQLDSETAGQRVSKREADKLNVLDQWILSRLNQTIEIVTQKLDGYSAVTASQAIQGLVDDLSLWYVRRSRNRVGGNDQEDDQNAFYQTIHYVLVTLTQLLAPFTPFLAEEIYQNLKPTRCPADLLSSCHLQNWPKAGEVDDQLLVEMELVRQVCELGHASRKEANLKVRQPLAGIEVQSPKLIDLDSTLIGLIKDELNVKKVSWVDGKEELKVELDAKITPALKAEGSARELVRAIQGARKKMGCKLEEKVTVELPNWPEKFEEDIKTKTLTKNLKKGRVLKIIRL